MFSLIICSRTNFISKELEENIKATIVAEYELIVIDNSLNKYSIFQAYNIGIKQSKGEYLVFLHDDILFRTVGWGNEIFEIFNENHQIGLIGVAGGAVKTKMPSIWWEAPFYVRIIQHYKSNIASEDKNQGFGNNDLIEVAVIDGVLMIMKKDSRIWFNENLIGFHNYDTDLALTHHRYNKKVFVTNQIVIEHFSGGTMDKNWYLSTSKFHKIYAPELPIIANSEIYKFNLKNMEFITGANFVMGLLNYNLKRDALYWWIKLIKMKFYSKFHFRFLKRFLKFYKLF